MQKLMTKSDDPNDDRFLTPNRFLIGQMGGDFVREIVETEPFNPKKVLEKSLRAHKTWVEPMNERILALYHRLDQDRNGNSVMTICVLEMLS